MKKIETLIYLIVLISSHNVFATDGTCPSILLKIFKNNTYSNKIIIENKFNKLFAIASKQKRGVVDNRFTKAMYRLFDTIDIFMYENPSIKNIKLR